MILLVESDLFRMTTPTRTALRLYRNVMRAHRESLPPLMRQLGDSYVRKEFKTHMYGAKCSIDQFNVFLQAWQEYLIKLSAGSHGEQLSEDQKKLLNEEQNRKLVELEQEIRRL